VGSLAGFEDIAKNDMGRYLSQRGGVRKA